MDTNSHNTIESDPSGFSEDIIEPIEIEENKKEDKPQRDCIHTSSRIIRLLIRLFRLGKSFVPMVNLTGGTFTYQSGNDDKPTKKECIKQKNKKFVLPPLNYEKEHALTRPCTFSDKDCPFYNNKIRTAAGVKSCWWQHASNRTTGQQKHAAGFIHGSRNIHAHECVYCQTWYVHKHMCSKLHPHPQRDNQCCNIKCKSYGELNQSSYILLPDKNVNRSYHVGREESTTLPKQEKYSPDQIIRFTKKYLQNDKTSPVISADEIVSIGDAKLAKLKKYSKRSDKEVENSYYAKKRRNEKAYKRRKHLETTTTKIRYQGKPSETGGEETNFLDTIVNGIGDVASIATTIESVIDVAGGLFMDEPAIHNTETITTKCVNVPKDVIPLSYKKDDLTDDQSEHVSQAGIGSMADFLQAGRLTILPWSTSTPVGQVILNIAVSPSLLGVSRTTPTSSGAFNDGRKLFEPTTLASMAQCFKLWKGTLIYTIEIIASKYHQGKLYICFDPASTKSTANKSLESVYTLQGVEIDLSRTQGTKLTVTYAGLSEFLLTAPTATLTAPLEYPYTNGNLAIYVVNALIATDQIANNVDINVYVEAGPDFEFKCPTNPCSELNYIEGRFSYQSNTPVVNKTRNYKPSNLFDKNQEDGNQATKFIFEQSYIVKTGIEVDVGDKVRHLITYLDIPDIYYDKDLATRGVLSYHNLFRCDIEVTISVANNSFYQGQLILVYVPIHDYANKFFDYYTSFNSATCLPHVRVDFGENNEGTFIIPYSSPFNYIRPSVYNANVHYRANDSNSFGRLELRCWNDIKAVSTTSQKVNALISVKALKPVVYLKQVNASLTYQSGNDPIEEVIPEAKPYVREHIINDHMNIYEYTKRQELKGILDIPKSEDGIHYGRQYDLRGGRGTKFITAHYAFRSGSTRTQVRCHMGNSGTYNSLIVNYLPFAVGHNDQFNQSCRLRTTDYDSNYAAIYNPVDHKCLTFETPQYSLTPILQNTTLDVNTGKRRNGYTDSGIIQIVGRSSGVTSCTITQSMSEDFKLYYFIGAPILYEKNGVTYQGASLKFTVDGRTFTNAHDAPNEYNTPIEMRDFSIDLTEIPYDPTVRVINETDFSNNPIVELCHQGSHRYLKGKKETFPPCRNITDTDQTGHKVRFFLVPANITPDGYCGNFYYNKQGKIIGIHSGIAHIQSKLYAAITPVDLYFLRFTAKTDCVNKECCPKYELPLTIKYQGKNATQVLNEQHSIGKKDYLYTFKDDIHTAILYTPTKKYTGQGRSKVDARLVCAKLFLKDFSEIHSVHENGPKESAQTHQDYYEQSSKTKIKTFIKTQGYLSDFSNKTLDWIIQKLTTAISDKFHEQFQDVDFMRIIANFATFAINIINIFNKISDGITACTMEFFNLFTVYTNNREFFQTTWDLISHYNLSQSEDFDITKFPVYKFIAPLIVSLLSLLGYTITNNSLVLGLCKNVFTTSVKPMTEKLIDSVSRVLNYFMGKSGSSKQKVEDDEHIFKEYYTKFYDIKKYIGTDKFTAEHKEQLEIMYLHYLTLSVDYDVAGVPRGRQFFRDLRNDYQSTFKKVINSEERMEPIVTHLSGPPGAGKSTLVDFLTKEVLLKTKYKDNYDICTTDVGKDVYYASTNPDEKFYDNYACQTVTVIDDLFATTEAKDVGNFLQLISSTPATLPMASMDEKGTTFRSSLIFSTSNFTGINDYNLIKDKKAVERRMKFAIHMKAKNGTFNIVEFTQRYEQAESGLESFSDIFKDYVEMELYTFGNYAPQTNKITVAQLVNLIANEYTVRTKVVDSRKCAKNVYKNIRPQGAEDFVCQLPNCLRDHTNRNCPVQFAKTITDKTLIETVSVPLVTEEDHKSQFFYHFKKGELSKAAFCALPFKIGNFMSVHCESFNQYFGIVKNIKGGAMYFKNIVQAYPHLVALTPILLALLAKLIHTSVKTVCKYLDTLRGKHQEFWLRYDSNADYRKLVQARLQKADQVRPGFYDKCKQFLSGSIQTYRNKPNIPYYIYFNSTENIEHAKISGEYNTEEDIYWSNIFDGLNMADPDIEWREQSLSKTVRQPSKPFRMPQRSALNTQSGNYFNTHMIENNIIPIYADEMGHTIGYGFLIDSCHLIINYHYLKVYDSIYIDKFSQKMELNITGGTKIGTTDLLIIRTPQFDGVRRRVNSILKLVDYECFVERSQVLLGCYSYTVGGDDKKVVLPEYPHLDTLQGDLLRVIGEPTIDGTCGTPYISSSHQIIGIHTGIDIADDHQLSIAPLIREEVLEAMQIVGGFHVESPQSDFIEIYNQEWTQNPHGFVDQGRFIGLDNKPIMATVIARTSKCHSDLYDDELFPNIYTPAPKSWEVLLNRSQKFGFTKTCHDPDPRDEAFALSLYESILPDNRNQNVLSESQVLCGTETLKEFNVKSSSGHWGAISNGKRAFIDVTYVEPDGHAEFSWSTGYYTLKHPKFGKTLCEFIEEREILGKQGIKHPDLFTTCCLKDELIKKPKAALGKTRVFECCPIDTTYLCKKYLGAFCHHYRQNPGYVYGHTIGMDKEANWRILFNNLVSINFQGSDQDYVEYDGSIPPAAFRFVEKFIELYYKDASVEENNMRRVLLHELIYTNLIIGKNIYRTNKGNKSGTYLTDLFNSIVNIWAWMTSFSRYYREHLAINASLKDWFTDFRIYTHGDDAINSFKDHININVIVGYIRELGFYITGANKEPLIIQKPIGELEYLKSSFRDCDGVMWPKMSHEVCNKEINWCKKTTKFDHRIRTTQVDEARHFKAYLGEQDLKDFDKTLNKAYLKHNDMFLLDTPKNYSYSHIAMTLLAKQNLAQKNNVFALHFRDYLRRKNELVT